MRRQSHIELAAIRWARVGLDFVHILQDRWIWKLSDPRMRATIGRDLFGQKEQAFSRPTILAGNHEVLALEPVLVTEVAS